MIRENVKKSIDTLNPQKNIMINFLRKKLKKQFVIIILLIIISFIVDAIAAKSIKTLFKKSYNYLSKFYFLKWYYTINYLSYYFVILFSILRFLFSNRLDNSLFYVLNISFIQYIQIIFKLIFIQLRPMFFYPDMSTENCVCEYGIISSFLTIFIAFQLFLIDDINQKFKTNIIFRIILYITLTAINLIIILGKISRGDNYFIQIVYSILISFFCFIVARRLEIKIKYFFILPILEKDFKVSKKFIYILLTSFFISNYSLFYLSNIRYFNFESSFAILYKIKNCYHCFYCESRNFSRNILTYGLFFNLYFGIYLGIYVLDKGNIKINFKYKNIEFWLIAITIFILLVFPLIIFDQICKEYIKDRYYIKIILLIVIGFIFSNKYITYFFPERYVIFN